MEKTFIDEPSVYSALNECILKFATMIRPGYMQKESNVVQIKFCVREDTVIGVSGKIFMDKFNAIGGNVIFEVIKGEKVKKYSCEIETHLISNTAKKIFGEMYKDDSVMLYSCPLVSIDNITNIVSKFKDLDPDIAKIINDNLFDLLGE